MADTAKTPAQHQMTNVKGKDDVKLLWEVGIPTDLCIRSNRPDLVLILASKVYLIDISVPLGINIQKKYMDKKLKYDDLRQAVKRMWGKPAEIVPIVVGSLGECGERLRESLELIGGGSWRVVQQQAILGTLKVVRKVLGNV